MQPELFTEVLCLFLCKGYRSPTLDLNIGNFGFAFPHIAGQDPYTVILDLGDHDMIIFLPVSVAHQSPSLPAMSSPHVTLQSIMTR